MSNTTTLSGNLTREWSRAGARCQHSGWSVSPTRSPNRTCDFHRIRLSASAMRYRALAIGGPLHGVGMAFPR